MEKSEMKIDVQKAIDNLTNEEQKELITNNLSACDIEDLIYEIIYRGDMGCMIREVTRRCDIEEVLDKFREKDIEEWLNNHAYEYDYTKVED